MDIIIPQISAVGVCIVVVCVLVTILKSIIPYKPIYVWLPIFISIPLGFMVALAECGWHLTLIECSLIKIFSICAGSMASYDVVSKTIKIGKATLRIRMSDEEFKNKFMQISDLIEKYKNSYNKLMKIRKKLLSKYWKNKRCMYGTSETNR